MAQGARQNGWRARLVAAVRSLAVRVTRWRPEPATAAGIRQLHLLVALVAPLIMVATIALMAQQQNNSAQASEQARAAGLQGYILAQAAMLGLDNANWNDAYEAVVHGFDREWMDSNWGPDAFGTIDYHDMFVLDDDARTLYASVMGERSALTAAQLLPTTLGPLLRAARDLGADHRRTVFAPYADGVAVVSATRVRPVDKSIARPGDPVRYLLTVKRLDPAALRALEAASGFSGLVVGPADAGANAVPFVGIDGRPFASLGWRSRAPGHASAQAVAPLAVLLLILLAYTGLIGARTASRWADEVLAKEAAARQLAELDALTSLPNRRSFVHRLEAVLAAGENATVLYVDLDGFKGVNDAFGHLAGDALLCAAAARISLVAGESGAHLARIGGDEFALFVVGDGPRAERLARAVVAAFAHPIEAADRQVFLGASVGIAGTLPGIDAMELIRHADVAMYAAKAAGRRRWTAYQPVMDAGRDVRQRVALELREAVSAGTIDVSYQPIVDAATERVIAAEALARWTSPTLGAVEPGLFISVAEEAGLISDLTRLVIAKAAQAAARWDDGVTLAVNLSAAEVWDASFADRLLKLLADAGLPASRLELEITESYLLRDPEGAAEGLAELRALGVQVALDDFGTGFASLGYLKRLPLDRLKLTCEFINGVSEAGARRELAAAVVRLGAAFGLPVTAEGVETPAQAEMLRDAGCRRLQGWLYGKPMSDAQFRRRLREAGVQRP